MGKSLPRVTQQTWKQHPPHPFRAHLHHLDPRSPERRALYVLTEEARQQNGLPLCHGSPSTLPSLSPPVPQESERRSWDSLRVQASQARTRRPEGTDSLKVTEQALGQP